MMSKKNNRKVFNVDDEDRISKLPDELIGNILSRLGTADAVATSILSKDWKEKWLHIYHIDITLIRQCSHGEMLLSFVNCVEKLFQSGINVTKICIRSSTDVFNGNLSFLASLISRFLKYKSEILEINAGDYKREIVVLGILLSSETLREMVLKYCFFKVPAESCFPHLNTLRLQNLVISREVETSNEIDNATSLKFILPVVETLEMYYCGWVNVKLVEIHAPSLRRLESTTRLYECSEVRNYEIKIFGATSPVTYVADGEFLDNIQFIGSNLVSASIQCLHEEDDMDTPFERGTMVKKLLRECLSTVVELELSYDNYKIFAEALTSESKHGCSLPIFIKLERLSVYCDSNTVLLLEFLHAVPFLKSLDIVADCIGEDDYDAVEFIPPCVMYKLEDIKLHLYINDHGEEDGFLAAFGFLKCFLQIGANAELTSFHCKMEVVDEKYSDVVMQKISSLPRAPLHFSLWTINWWNKQTKYFCYRESSGWVEYAAV